VEGGGSIGGSGVGLVGQELSAFNQVMIKRKDLTDILEEALLSLGGEGKIVEICEYIWGKYKDDLLRLAIFFTPGSMI